MFSILRNIVVIILLIIVALVISIAPWAQEGQKPLQRGTASWYGMDFHGNYTASGEVFNAFDDTAAHPSLPFGTRIIVHYPKTGKAVAVRINDRGPFIQGRIIDLSMGAAEKIDLINDGIGTVELYKPYGG